MTYHLGLWRHYKIKSGLSQEGDGARFTHIVGTSTSESENYVMVQTRAGWHTANTKATERAKRKTAFIDIERDSLLTQLKLVPTKKYFLPVTRIRETNDAQNSCKSIWSFRANYDYQVHTELDDEVQTGEGECMKNSIAETIPRMAKPPG